MMNPYWGMAPQMQMDRSLGVLQRDLNLTASQVSQVRQLIDSRKDKFKSIGDQVTPKFDYLMSLLNQPNPDPAAVGRATIALKQAHEQMRAEQAGLETTFMGILNDTQRQTLNRLRVQAPSVLALYRLGLLAPDWMGSEQAVTQSSENFSDGC
jgi:Spy/CpxP family protein refolding chaperone